MTTDNRFQSKWFFWVQFVISLAVFSGHAFYIRYQAALPADGWADVGVGTGALWGFESYINEQEDRKSVV